MISSHTLKTNMNIEDVFRTSPPKKKRSTGILGLDLLLNGGWSYGRIVEIAGGERSGKSTIAYCSAAASQVEHGSAIWITARPGSFVKHYAVGCGVDLKKIYVIELTTIDEALTVLKEICVTTNTLCVVDDLCRGAKTYEEFSNVVPVLTKEDTGIIAAALQKSGATVLLNTDIELTRKLTPPFWIAEQVYTARTSSTNMDVIIQRSTDGQIGRGINIPLIPEIGVNHDMHLLDLGVAIGIIEERSAHYVYESKQLGHGRKKATESISRDDSLAEALRNRIITSEWERATKAYI